MGKCGQMFLKGDAMGRTHLVFVSTSPDPLGRVAAWSSGRWSGPRACSGTGLWAGAGKVQMGWGRLKTNGVERPRAQARDAALGVALTVLCPGSPICTKGRGACL